MYLLHSCNVSGYYLGSAPSKSITLQPDGNLCFWLTSNTACVFPSWSAICCWKHRKYQLLKFLRQRNINLFLLLNRTISGYTTSFDRGSFAVLLLLNMWNSYLFSLRKWLVVIQRKMLVHLDQLLNLNRHSSPVQMEQEKWIERALPDKRWRFRNKAMVPALFWYRHCLWSYPILNDIVTCADDILNHLSAHIVIQEVSNQLWRWIGGTK
jgi:hypothetical protein